MEKAPRGSEGGKKKEMKKFSPFFLLFVISVHLSYFVFLSLDFFQKPLQMQHICMHRCMQISSCAASFGLLLPTYTRLSTCMSLYTYRYVSACMCMYAYLRVYVGARQFACLPSVREGG